jgi:hypothetical protein
MASRSPSDLTRIISGLCTKNGFESGLKSQSAGHHQAACDRSEMTDGRLRRTNIECFPHPTGMTFSGMVLRCVFASADSRTATGLFSCSAGVGTLSACPRGAEYWTLPRSPDRKNRRIAPAAAIFTTTLNFQGHHAIAVSDISRLVRLGRNDPGSRMS